MESSDNSGCGAPVVSHALGLLQRSALTPEQLEAAYQRARQMLAADLNHEARAVLEALLLLQPQAVRVVRSLAIAYMRDARFHGARDMLAYGMRLDPSDILLPMLHGECVMLCGDHSLGLALLAAALPAAASVPLAHAYVLRAQKCLQMARQGATP